MDKTFDFRELLEYIDPASLSYKEWLSVGMALKEEGYTAADWESWSAADSRRYHPGECARKWETFNGSQQPVTAGTLVSMARSRGWQTARGEYGAAEQHGRELDWDDEIGIGFGEGRVVNSNREVDEPENWDPVRQLIDYLNAVFCPEDYVGYVTRSFQNDDGRFLPTKGCWDRTAGQLIGALEKCGGDMGAALGDYNPEAGAWIRFNPLDGKGVKNDNVVSFRYALVESDSLPIEEQNAIIRQLELPIAALVHSGGKSLHAIVRIEAQNYSEYRTRVDYLYKVCQKNGLSVDTNNRNPSRLSRMPGVIRKGRKQFLIGANLGKGSWAEWREWMESVTDDLPGLESMADAWDHLPELSPALIDGVLRQGHKLLLAGPSKAGKSFALIELCCAIAEGRPWLGFPCAQGKVLYVNLELDRASCLHRFKDVYTALGWAARSLTNIDVWNLRGNSIPMDKLAPRLIWRASQKNYLAVIIDPIYKVITGDENSADQMAHFCNQFDKVCTELGCAVIYCHHHSKGAQGGKRSMDRASGSGVFARDPDALLDLIELPVSEGLKKQEENKAQAEACARYLTAQGLEDRVGPDDLCSGAAMLEACRRLLPGQLPAIEETIRAEKQRAGRKTAWRLSGTLREFPTFPDLNLWFDYPIHRSDPSGALGDIRPEETASWQQKAKTPPKDRKRERLDALATAFSACDMDGDQQVSLADLMDYTGKARNTVKNWVEEHPEFTLSEGGMVKRSDVKSVKNDF